MTNELPPMPRDFGWRYVMWFLWNNANTGLGTLQVIVGTILAGVEDPTDKTALLSWTTVRWLLIINGILVTLVARIKGNNPPQPPPLKQQSAVAVIIPAQPETPAQPDEEKPSVKP